MEVYKNLNLDNHHNKTLLSFNEEPLLNTDVSKFCCTLSHKYFERRTIRFFKLKIIAKELKKISSSSNGNLSNRKYWGIIKIVKCRMNCLNIQ